MLFQYLLSTLVIFPVVTGIQNIKNPHKTTIKSTVDDCENLQKSLYLKKREDFHQKSLIVSAANQRGITTTAETGDNQEKGLFKVFQSRSAIASVAMEKRQAKRQKIWKIWRKAFCRILVEVSHRFSCKLQGAGRRGEPTGNHGEPTTRQQLLTIRKRPFHASARISRNREEPQTAGQKFVTITRPLPPPPPPPPPLSSTPTYQTFSPLHS